MVQLSEESCDEFVTRPIQVRKKIDFTSKSGTGYNQILVPKLFSRTLERSILRRFVMKISLCN